ncbi:MAG: hypothetical protein A2V62_02325 [Nitrospirae bacterium RBG_19FT_COMBO_58_9]|nr:MAG: hypothetical protein A2V62_02325 [Nitrospirae bacterium RBG_19FT_COMBO_58_9]
MFELRAPRLRGDALLLDQVVAGATLGIRPQELVGHIPVPKKERRGRGAPLFKLQAIIAVGEDRISDNRVGIPVGWLGSSLNFSRRTAEKLVTSSVYETLLSAMADHSAMTLRGTQARAKRPREKKRLVGKRIGP